MQVKKYMEKDRYGNTFSFEFDVPAMQEIPNPEIFQPKGTDTVPAMLTPGENVVNAEASRLPGVQSMLDKLNDKGRAIQKEQGGPIPSYNSEGTKVEGKPAGKDTGMRTVTDKKVYETPDGYKMSEQRITVGDNTHGYGHVPSIYEGIQYKPQQVEQMLYQGQIPQPDMRFKTPTEADYYARLNSQNLMNFRDDASYLQNGGVITEDMMPNVLDAMKFVETGNNPNQVSEAGAAGPYQITNATAAKPGYGVQAISGADRFNEEKSRAFAKQYLLGIMKAHPEFTKDEVITAYHSGVGNVLKSRSGEEALGPRGQAYAGKVNTAMGEVPTIITYDATEQKPGFMSAQASTLNRIGDPGYVPDANDPPLPTTDTSVGAITDKREDEFFDYKNFQTSALLNNEVAIQNDLEELNKKIEQKKANGEEIADYDIEKKKALDKRLERVRERIINNQNAIDTENKEDKEAQLEKDKVFSVEREVDVNADMQKKKDAAQAITDQLNNEEDIDQTVMSQPEVDAFIKKNPNLQPEDGLIDVAKKYGGVVVDKSIEYFKNAFSSMFNGEELARMALTYAGSRVLGYNHGGSLNYSMKNYIKRVDANLAAAKKFSLTDKAREDYTEESLKKYAQTGNRNDLIPKSKSVSVVAPAGSVYVKGIGVVPTFKMSDKSERLQIKGQYLLPNDPSIANRVEKIDASVHGIAAIKKNFSDFIKSEMSVANSELGLGESTVNGVKKDNSFKVNDIELAQEAEAFYSNILKSNYLSLRDAAPYEAAVGRGIKQYIKALGSAKVNETRAPTSLKAYLNAQTFIPLSGVSVDMVSKTTPKEMLQITNKVVSQIPSKIRKSSPIYRLVFKAEWDMRIKAWQNLTDTQREEFNLQAAKRTKPASGTNVAVGWDGFTWWASKAKESEIKKILDDAGIDIPTISG